MKISKFQVILLAVFILFIVIGVAAFATYKGSGSNTELPPITIWGTFPSETFSRFISEVNLSLPQSLNVTYVEHRPESFSQAFIAALARGQGPDAILIAADTLLPHQDKLVSVPFSALSQRDFLDTYIREAEIYLRDDGVIGVPFTVDPLIMFWNRDTFDAAGLPTYPRYWDEFTELNKKLTTKDQNGNVRKSAIAMGEFVNVNNAREILGTLLMQMGNPITFRAADGEIISTIKTSAASSPIPALDFYTKFSNPSSPDYSWNRGLATSKSAFLSGMLATYFGFASELLDIRNKNPNLNFDAALIPQIRTGGQKANYAKMYGFSITRSSPNQNAAYQVIAILTSPQYLQKLSTTLYLPTVRRDIIATEPADLYMSIFNSAALSARTWVDADPALSREVFATMVDDITSGKKSMHQAVQDAGDRYDQVLRKAVE